jgi:hypothetical protein
VGHPTATVNSASYCCPGRTLHAQPSMGILIPKHSRPVGGGNSRHSCFRARRGNKKPHGGPPPVKAEAAVHQQPSLQPPKQVGKGRVGTAAEPLEPWELHRPRPCLPAVDAGSRCFLCPTSQPLPPSCLKGGAGAGASRSPWLGQGLVWGWRGGPLAISGLIPPEAGGRYSAARAEAINTPPRTAN